MSTEEIQNLLNTSVGEVSLGAVVSGIVTLVICLFVIRLVIRALKKVLGKTSVDERVQGYIAAGVRLVLYVITGLIVADSVGIPVSSLVAMVSVLSLAISLAVQDILSDVAGGIVVLFSKPFKVGDYIETSDGEGTVAEIGLTYTCINTSDNVRVMLPNSTISSGKIVNYTTLGMRRVRHNVTASYDAPTETVRKALFAAVEKTNKVLSDPGPSVYLYAYKDSAIEYSVRCWATCDDFWDVYYELLANIREAFEEANVEMTYNHLNVHVIEKK
ncbi:MAG: mechanosensitive ion channel family protein [Oscillospiraceae bacterium]|nr:mechanosensitive ion channel family protein [Oscillospiraceae bacterium]